MPIRNIQQNRSDQRWHGEIDVQHPRRLLLQHQNGVLPGGLDGLELCSPVRQTETGQVNSLPPHWPRFQRGGEHHRIPVPHGKQFGTPKNQPGDLTQRHIADVTNAELWRLTDLHDLRYRWPGGALRSRNGGIPPVRNARSLLVKLTARAPR